MSRFNPFIGQLRPQLETWLREAQEDLASGATLTAAGAGDTNVQRRVNIEPEKRIELLYRALNAIDPETYPLSAITRVTRTKIEVFPDNNY